MGEIPSLEEWNSQELMLVQALVGAISGNFRMIVMLWSKGEWLLQFYIQDDVEEDVEEVEDIVCQYTAYQDHLLKCSSEIIIGA